MPHVTTIAFDMRGHPERFNLNPAVGFGSDHGKAL